MGLYKRKDSKIWWMCFTYNGKQVCRSTKTDNMDLAMRVLKSTEGQIAERKWFPETKENLPEYSFEELVEKYLSWAMRQKAFTHWKRYIVKQLKGQFEKYNLNEFNTYDLEHFQSKCLEKGNKPATVNRLIAVISHMFTKAIEWNMMDEKIVASIHVKMLPEENKRLRFLSEEEIHKLINVCNSYLKPVVITALNTGMRRGEIFSLEWDKHIDLKHNFILLEKTKNGERREIPINATLRATFKSLVKRLDIPYAFYNPKTGKPYLDLKKSFHTALRKAGIKNFTFHDLRHTFASHLVMAGVDLTTVKELLGHKDIKMTLRYAHLAPSHRIKAMNILDKALQQNYYVFTTFGEEVGNQKQECGMV